MKYFISNKVDNHLDFTKISVEDFLALSDSNSINSIRVFAGTFESMKEPEKLLNKIKSLSSSETSIDLSFINIYQMFVDAAYHRLDVGIAHLVCRSIERPFNTSASINFITENKLNIKKTWFEDNSTILRIDCSNE